MRLGALGGAAGLAAALVAGCSTLGPGFRCPAAGGAPWRELASEHFVVRTDLDDGAAAGLVEQLEVLRGAVRGALFPGTPDPPGRVEVVAFRTEEEYRPFAPPGVAAYYLRHEGGPPLIVLAGEPGARQRMVIAHELTHHLASFALLRKPPWLSEGLAVYAESLGEQPLGRRLLAGKPPLARLEVAREGRVPTRQVLRWDAAAFPGPGHYAAAWLLVHFLVHRRPEALVDLERRLGRGEEPGDAWRSAFPEYDPALPGALERLDRALQLHARTEARAAAREIEVRASGAFVEEPMPPAEVHALRLAIGSLASRADPAAVRAEVAEALREDPAHPLVLGIRAELDGLEPRPLARASVAAHPDDPRAWTFLASSLGDEREAAEREGAYRRAAELAPESPAALYHLFAELRTRERPGEALPLARRAARLAPWSAPIVDGYAAVLADLGRCEQALRAQRRAVEVVADGATAAWRDEVRTRLSEYERRCGTSLEARGMARGALAPEP